MPDVLHEKPGLHEPHGAKTPRKAALASWIGSAVQYYDFFLYGTAAALVFPDLFFPTADPSSARLASFATFGVAYAARTIGAVVLGHFGDRIGRKTMLIFTLLLMGASTIAIGLLPTYAQVGILAPILLVVLRLLQGLSAAGEQAGANSMALEHAPADRRGYFTSFTLSGTQMELILATLVFLPIGALPEDALQSWGWRVPFLLSTIVVAVGLWVRRALPETPAFEEVDEGTRRPPSPPPSCSARTASTSCASSSAPSSPWSARSSPSSRCRTPSTRSASRARACSASSCGQRRRARRHPLFAALSDRIGRRPVFIFGCVGSAALIWPYMWAIGRENYLLVFLLGVLLSGVVYSAANGVWPSFYGEMFGHPRVLLRHGHRHAGRLRDRGLRAADQRGDPRRRRQRLGAGRCVHHRGGPAGRRLRRHCPRDQPRAHARPLQARPRPAPPTSPHALPTGAAL